VKPSLQTKLLVNFMLVVALILAGFAIGSSALIRQYFLSAKQQELIGKGQEMARVMDDFMTGRLSAPELVELADRIDGFLGARIWAVDTSGRIIVMSSTPRRSMPDRPANPVGPRLAPGGSQAGGVGGMRSSTSTAVRNLLKDIEPVFSGNILTRTFFHPYYNEDMMLVAVPIVNVGGAISGAVILNAPVQGVNDFLARVYMTIGVVGLLALGLTLLVVRRLSRGIVRPLKEMQETAAFMAEGRYDNRVKIASQDEVGQLGQSLNTLAQELGRFVERTEQMEKLRRDFVANVSHELRTPLTIIRGYTEALQDGTVTRPEQAQRFTKLIVGETERLERLISDLLDLSRLQASQFVMELEMIPLVEVVDNVVTMLRGKYAEKGVELIWHGAEMIPPIPGNGDRLVQLMLILLDNALKYTQPQGRVQVELNCADQTVTLVVSDDGAGIPAADLPFIWERFYKVDKAHTRENHGTGLGLSIAREIIERHGATVAVSSEPGTGTRFVLQFPVRSLQGQ
jgi:signal transduction histidine kinase